MVGEQFDHLSTSRAVGSEEGDIAVRNGLMARNLVPILIGALVLGFYGVCLADPVDLAKEVMFGVSNHGHVEHNIPIFDGFSFHRLENPHTKAIDSSKGITFTYKAEYKTVDFARMKESVVSSKTYSGAISSGEKETFIRLETLMADLGVKDYEGVIGITVLEWNEGVSCAGIGDAIDLRLVKISLDAIAKAGG